MTPRAPLLELCFHSVRDEREFREVSVMKAKSANEFPDPLNGVKIRTVGRKELESETILV